MKEEEIKNMEEEDILNSEEQQESVADGSEANGSVDDGSVVDGSPVDEEQDPLEKALAEIEQLKTQMLYKTAEFDNYRKRTLK